VKRLFDPAQALIILPAAVLRRAAGNTTKMTDANAPVILVVEDEEIVREMVCMDLEEAGFRVREAANGDEAIRIIRQSTEDHAPLQLLFTDIRMPGATDGWSLAEMARELKPDLKVLYASGFSAEQNREVPGSVFISKPYRTSLLIEKIRQLGAV
jgi:CheY-like chemotaxis protein